MTAVQMVTRRRVKEAYPRVALMLQSDPDVEVRIVSTHAVKRLGGRKAIGLLIQALADPGVTRARPPRTVEGAARFWLRSLTGQALVDQEDWEHWWQENARR